MAASPFERILVGYTPTDRGLDARALGVDLAAACGSDLVIAGVLTALWLESFGEQRGPAVVHGEDREHAAIALQQAVSSLSANPSLHSVTSRLEPSRSRARGLHDAAVAEHADLMVVGSSHRGPLGRVLLGSVAERLLAAAPCAIAVAPRGHALRESRPINVVAAAYDGSEEATTALHTAHAIARRTGAVLRVVTVIEPLTQAQGHLVPLPGVEGIAMIERAQALQRQENTGRAALEEAVDGLGGGTAVMPQLLFGGDPADAILDCAREEEADLLVLGSRAYGPVRRVLMGTVSGAVVRHAPCSVLITPRPDGGARAGAGAG
ncbi:MAG: universal stress protein [Solirubrobacteraceae bacterium]